MVPDGWGLLAGCTFAEPFPFSTLLPPPRGSPVGVACARKADVSKEGENGDGEGAGRLCDCCPHGLLMGASPRERGAQICMNLSECCLQYRLPGLATAKGVGCAATHLCARFVVHRNRSCRARRPLCFG